MDLEEEDIKGSTCKNNPNKDSSELISHEQSLSTKKEKILTEKNNSKLQLMSQLHPDVDVNGEVILDDFYCSLHKEIIINGRLRVCIKHLWFYANIFGIETTAILKWSDIISITRQKSALIIPNAIQILTPTEKVFLSGFVNRDKTYLLLHQLWHFTLNNQNAILPDKLYKMLTSSRLSVPTGTTTNECSSPKLFKKSLTLNQLSSSQSFQIEHPFKIAKSKNKLASDPSIVDKEQNSASTTTGGSMHTVDKYNTTTTTTAALDSSTNKLPQHNDKYSSSSNSNTSTMHQSTSCAIDDEELTESSDYKSCSKTDSARPKKTLKLGLKLFKKKKKNKKSLSLQCDNNNTTPSSMIYGDDITPNSDNTSNGNSSITTDEHGSMLPPVCNSDHLNSLLTTTPSSISPSTTTQDDVDDEADNNTSLSSEEQDAPAECDCSYLPNHIAQELMYVDYNDLFDQLFSLSSDVNKEFIQIKKLSNYSSNDTPGNNDNEFMRETTYSIPLQWCGKSIKTTANHTVIKKNGHIKVSCSSTAEGMPYGNTFITHVHYCIKSMGDNCCVINASFNIEYTRSVWVVTRKIIDKEVKYNINEFIILLLQLVKNNLNKSPCFSLPDDKVKLSDDGNVVGRKVISEKVIVPPRKCSSAVELNSTAEVSMRKLSGRLLDFKTEEKTFGDKLYNHLGSNYAFNGKLVKNIYNSMVQGLNQIKETTTTTLPITGVIVSDTIVKSVTTVSSIKCVHVLLFLILIYLIFILKAINNLSSTVSKFVRDHLETCPVNGQFFNLYKPSG